MGKALSGKLSCPCDRSCYGTIRKIKERVWLSGQRHLIVMEKVISWLQEKSLCQPCSKWVPFFFNQGRIMQQKGEMGSTFHMLYRYSGL